MWAKATIILLSPKQNKNDDFYNWYVDQSGSIEMGLRVEPLRGLAEQMSRAATFQKTWKDLLLRAQAEIEFFDELYLASPDTILDTAMRRGEDHGRVMVVGHNPGMEDVMTLLGLGMHEMPTAALAHISFDVDEWALATSASRITLEHLWLARELPE